MSEKTETTDPEQKPITSDDLREWFGERMPVEVISLLWDAPGNMTIGEVRAAVRKMAREVSANGR